MGESVMKSVKPVGSTRLNAPGDMEENMVSKISKLLSSPKPPLLDNELSRQVLNNGSFRSNTLPVELGMNADRGALEVVDGIVLNPFDKLGDCLCVSEANVAANVSKTGDVFCI